MPRAFPQRGKSVYSGNYFENRYNLACFGWFGSAAAGTAAVLTFITTCTDKAEAIFAFSDETTNFHFACPDDMPDRKERFGGRCLSGF
ncbi:MAG: hypothetical protein JWM68_1216 [Verrucomicrobiales bacterium]|nr:hypothetical protein [Verrucomicrobiales bacterium]